MDRVPGVELETIWARLDDTERDPVFAQLASFVAQMRAVQSPHGSAICAIDGGPVHDDRLPRTRRGPFASEEDFNAVLR